MKGPAEEIARYLVAEGYGTLGGSAGWSINFGKEPTKPDTCITVYDTGGGEPDTDELDLHDPTIQIRVRGKKYNTAHAKMETIRRDLIKAVPVMESYSVLAILCTTSIASIGPDDSGRDILTCNFKILVQDTEI